MKFLDVITYINSGNVIFTSDIEDTNSIAEMISLMIKDKFNLDVSVYIITITDLVIILKKAPKW